MRLAWFGLILLAPAAVVPALELARPFGPHMVLPMEVGVPVWGRAGAGAEVVVCFAGQEQRTKATADGEWRLELAAMEASFEPGKLVVTSGGRSLELDDVLVGEVWLCSGQSNMDYPLRRATGGQVEARGAGEFPAIRLMNLEGVATGNRAFSGRELARLTPDRKSVV